MAQLGNSTFNTTVQPSPGQVNAATLSLTTGTTDTLSSMAISNMLPSQSVNEYINLQNGSSVNLSSITLGAEDCATSPSSSCTPSSTSTPSALVTAGGTSPTTSDALYIEIQSCSVAWTTSNGTCSGTTSTVLAQTPLYDLLSAGGGPVALTLPSSGSALAQGGTSYLMATIGLGSSAPNSDQGLADDIAFQFTGTAS